MTNLKSQFHMVYDVLRNIREKRKLQKEKYLLFKEHFRDRSNAGIVIVLNIHSAWAQSSVLTCFE